MKKYKYSLNRKYINTYNDDNLTSLKLYLLENKIYTLALDKLNYQNWNEILEKCVETDKYKEFYNSLYEVEKYRSNQIMIKFEEMTNKLVEINGIQAIQDQVKEYSKINAVDNIVFKKLRVMKCFNDFEEYWDFDDDKYFMKIEKYMRTNTISLEELTLKDLKEMIMYNTIEITWEQKCDIFYEEFALLTLFTYKTPLSRNLLMNSKISNIRNFKNLIQLTEEELSIKVKDYEHI